MASIIELIKNIRNARLGKDVRESIASAIEQTYEDASKDGNANMEVSEARGTFDTLNQRLNNIDEKTKKIVLIGDSYLVGYTPDGNITSWGTYFKNYLNIPNGNISINGVGGAGFAQSNSFTNIVNGLTSDDNVTDVIVAGGYNDLTHSETNVKNGIISFKNACNAKFPNAKIHIAMIGWANDSSKIFNLYNTARWYNTYAQENGMHFMNGTQYTLHDYFNMFASDNFHPNETGQKAIARSIVNAFLSGSTEVLIPYKSISISPSDNCTDISGNTSNLATTMNNSNLQISSQGTIQLDFENNVSYTADGKYELPFANIVGGCVIGTNYKITQIPINISIALQGWSYITVPAFLIIKNKKLYLSFSVIKDDSTGYKDLTIRRINILPFASNFESLFC